MNMTNPTSEKTTGLDIASPGFFEKVRVLILGLFLFSLTGTGIELLLLEHTEDAWMWTPLILMAGSLLLLASYAFTKAPTVLKGFRVLMLVFVISGFVGTWLHFKGNMEFELEMYPAMAGFELLKETLMGATPALAPGAMIQLGLIGLIFTYKHPLLKKA